MNNISFGVVVINRNEEKWIADTVYSIISQTKSFDEIIIIDNNSTDKSSDIACNILNDFSKKFHIFYNLKNEGLFESINEIIPKCNSDYLLFLSANDILEDNIVSVYNKQLSQFGKTPAIISGLSNLIDSNGMYLKKLKTPILSSSSIYLNSHKCKDYVNKVGYWFTGPTIMYKKSHLINTNLFNIKLMGYADLVKSVVLSINYGAIYVPMYLAKIRMHEDGFFTHSKDYFVDIFPFIAFDINEASMDKLFTDNFIIKLNTSLLISNKNSFINNCFCLLSYKRIIFLLIQFYYRYIKFYIFYLFHWYAK